MWQWVNGLPILVGGGGGVAPSGDAQPADVVAPRTFINANGEQVGTMPDRGNLGVIMPGTVAQNIPPGFITGGSVAGDAELLAGNIKQGVNLFNVLGTYAGATPVFSEKRGTVNSGAPFSSTANEIRFRISFTALPFAVCTGYGLKLQQGTGVTNYVSWSGYANAVDGLGAASIRISYNPANPNDSTHWKGVASDMYTGLTAGVGATLRATCSGINFVGGTLTIDYVVGAGSSTVTLNGGSANFDYQLCGYS